MRRRTDQPTTVWNAQVDSVVLQDLKERLPITGLRTWLIIEGLTRFIEDVRHSPSAQKIVRDEVEYMLHADKGPVSGPLDSINVRIPTPLYNEFNQLFPAWGSTTWFIRNFLQSFRLHLGAHDIRLGIIVAESVSPLYRPKRPAVDL